MRRSDAHGPHNAVLVVALLNGGRHAARHAHAIAAHDERLLDAVFVHERDAHGLGVLRAELENLTGFDAACNGKGLAALRAGVAFLYHAQVLPSIHRKVFTLLGARKVEAVDICAHEPALDAAQAFVGGDFYALGQADRAHGALHEARILHFSVGKRREFAEQVLDGHLVHLIVAGNEQHPQRAVGGFAGKRLHAGVFGGTQKCSKLLDGVHTRSLELRKRVGRVRHGMRRGLGGFGVGRITAGAACDFSLARVGKHHVFLRSVAADLARVGHDHAVIEAHAVEHVDIGLAHASVAGIQAGFIGVEAVGVLHNELAAAHERKTRAALVAELHLNLVEVLRQVFIAAKLVVHEIGHDFLVRGTKAELVVVAVGHAQKLGAVNVPAARTMPQLSGLHERHKNFLAAVGIHFLTHDGLDFANNAHAERQEGVQAGGFLANHARANEQLRRFDVGVRRVFLQRGSVDVAHAQNGLFANVCHGWFLFYVGSNAEIERVVRVSMERAPPSCSAESDAIEPAPQHRGRSSEKSMHRTLARRRAKPSFRALPSARLRYRPRALFARPRRV